MYRGRSPSHVSPVDYIIVDKGEIMKNLYAHRRHHCLVDLIPEDITGQKAHHRPESLAPY